MICFTIGVLGDNGPERLQLVKGSLRRCEKDSGIQHEKKNRNDTIALETVFLRAYSPRWIPVQMLDGTFHDPVTSFRRPCDDGYSHSMVAGGFELMS